ncbi:hypothetical protein [Streptomyces sp. NPDC004528]|uniref:hypothetical protein n=1 Tax=Streptomyces sp. NPDC004528 TaxID=3154550 RepID=UPI0033AE0B52
MTDLTKTEQLNFLGIPIEGDLHAGSTRVEQISKEEFGTLLKTVIEHPEVKLVGWHQYTPYFNDGDVCEFSASGVYVITVHDAEQYEELQENDPYMVEETFSSSADHPTLGGRPWIYDRTTFKGEYGPYEGNYPELWEAVDALATAIGSGSSDSVLLGHFGDHAKILVTTDKIEIEHYSHD